MDAVAEAVRGGESDMPLRLAIVQCAISDYYQALKKLKKHMGRYITEVSTSEIVKEDVEAFFRGAWYEMEDDLK